MSFLVVQTFGILSAPQIKNHSKREWMQCLRQGTKWWPAVRNAPVKPVMQENMVTVSFLFREFSYTEGQAVSPELPPRVGAAPRPRASILPRGTGCSVSLASTHMIERCHWVCKGGGGFPHGGMYSVHGLNNHSSVSNKRWQEMLLKDQKILPEDLNNWLEGGMYVKTTFWCNWESGHLTCFRLDFLLVAGPVFLCWELLRKGKLRDSAKS